MKRGLMGGTFDPIHLGHLALARSARERLGLDLVEFIPCHLPPHKARPDLTEAHRRLAMVKLACEGEKGLAASAREVERGGVSFTVVTLRELKAEAPRDELFFLVGADSLTELGSWVSPDEIVHLARVVAFNRPGHEPSVPEFLKDRLVPAGRGTGVPGEVWTLEMPPVDLSSTGVRETAARGGSLAGLVPPAVAQYIEKSGLYRQQGSA